jgi:hypothetical protein
MNMVCLLVEAAVYRHAPQMNKDCSAVRNNMHGDSGRRASVRRSEFPILRKTRNLHAKLALTTDRSMVNLQSQERVASGGTLEMAEQGSVKRGEVGI